MGSMGDWVLGGYVPAMGGKRMARRQRNRSEPHMVEVLVLDGEVTIVFNVISRVHEFRGLVYRLQSLHEDVRSRNALLFWSE